MTAAGLLLILAASGLVRAEEPPCLPAGPQGCAVCHPTDAGGRFDQHRRQPCTPYCQNCHQDLVKGRHHTVGLRLERPPRQALCLDGAGQIACTTCHRLDRPRYDTVPWRAESLFNRLFRRQDRHPTYLLVERNDRGQLCKACH